LGLGTWLGFTDAKIGRSGEWIGLENFQFLVGDAVALLSLFNTLFYTVVQRTIARMNDLREGAGEKHARATRPAQLEPLARLCRKACEQKKAGRLRRRPGTGSSPGRSIRRCGRSSRR